MSIIHTIATELNIDPTCVEATFALLDKGAALPFIARYRKDITQNLDNTKLRLLATRRLCLKELEAQRTYILDLLKTQEKLTPALEEAIVAAETKVFLEDLACPFRPKRHSKASLAKEAGLEPLAQTLYQDPTQCPQTLAENYINPEKGITELKKALEGARHILIEHFTEQAPLNEKLRQALWDNAYLKSTLIPGKEIAGNKYKDYFNFQEPFRKIPKSRALLLLRGKREGCLKLTLTHADPATLGFAEDIISQYFNIQPQSQAGPWLREVCHLAWYTHLFPKFEKEFMGQLRDHASVDAIDVFAKNLKNLLLSAPAGPKTTLGLDPGIYTGVKAAVVDPMGHLLDYQTLYPFAPLNDWQGSITALAKLAIQYKVELISIGKGMGTHEIDRLCSELIKRYPDLTLTKIIVQAAGASAYAGSAYAKEELPELDATLRGAVSIARRLQDPLKELVKIDPRSLGIQQSQQDVSAKNLAHALDQEVEACVHAVGVDVNTAAYPLLCRVSGINETIARNIIAHRIEHGKFATREDLKAVAGIDDTVFQQAAGFLYIHGGAEPLDHSRIHPEAYYIVQKILKFLHEPLSQVIGNTDLLRTLPLEQFVDETHGLFTLKDLIAELENPGQDPRPLFKTVTFKPGVEAIAHLKVGMILEGIVDNLTHFGAFVDIGVHQNGLLHVSQMKEESRGSLCNLIPGDIVTVRVIEINLEKRRIGLSLCLTEKPQRVVREKPIKTAPIAPFQKKSEAVKPMQNTIMADLLSSLKLKM